ncbi:WbuC family cupin fold metalloprotein [Leptospira sp. 96542]|nr:WbuC family cupin fold metalloprotein [Leptospira sp. 96542]
MQEIQLIDSQLFSNLSQKAIQAPRKRTNHNFHELTEVYQRFLNVLTKGTYIAPHRHWNDPKPETFVVLEGKIGFLIFNQDGSIQETHTLSSDGSVRGIDLQPGVWHTLVCLSDVAICFEGKSGPYDPNIDKEFLQGYPEEGDDNVKNTIERFESLFS